MRGLCALSYLYLSFVLCMQYHYCDYLSCATLRGYLSVFICCFFPFLHVFNPRFWHGFHRTSSLTFFVLASGVSGSRPRCSRCLLQQGGKRTSSDFTCLLTFVTTAYHVYAALTSIVSHDVSAAWPCIHDV